MGLYSGPSRPTVRGMVHRLAATAVLLATGLASTASAARFAVSSEALESDVAPGDGACASASGTCTLQAALDEAAALPGHDVITLPTGAFPSNPTLQGMVTLEGAGDGTTITSWLRVESGAVVHLRRLSLAREVYSWGDVSTADCAMNSVNILSGRADIARCRIHPISEGMPNGGIHQAGGDVTVRDTTVSDGGGAGVHITGGRLTMDRCTMSRNAGYLDGLTYRGGGVFACCGATLTMSNCTISSNDIGGGRVTRGGGLYLEDVTARLEFCTVAENSAFAMDFFPIRAATAEGGGIFATRSLVTLAGTLVARNTVDARSQDPTTDGPDCWGSFSAESPSIVELLDGTCGVTPVSLNRSIDPQLGPLTDDGGFVPVHPLMPGSPAIDQVPATLDLDGRRMRRPQGPLADIGAYEVSDIGPDGDGDGIPDIADDCANVPDVDQGDEDGDGIGDACDVCPDTIDPSQLDADGNGIGDACQECAEPASALRRGSLPLLVTRSGGLLLLAWEDTGTPEHELYSGTIAALRTGAYDHSAAACRLTAPVTTAPFDGIDRYYLAAGRCGTVHSVFGMDSFLRPLPAPMAACP